MNREEVKSLQEFEQKFIASQESLEADFEKVFWENYWELLA